MNANSNQQPTMKPRIPIYAEYETSDGQKIQTDQVLTKLDPDEVSYPADDETGRYHVCTVEGEVYRIDESSQTRQRDHRAERYIDAINWPNASDAHYFLGDRAQTA